MTLTLAAVPALAWQEKQPEKQKKPPQLSAEEKEILKNRDLLENMELLRNLEQLQFFEFLGGKKTKNDKDKPGAKPPVKGSDKKYEKE